MSSLAKSIKKAMCFNRYGILMFVLSLIAVSLISSRPVHAFMIDSSSISHLLKLNIYDSTNLTTMIETCDSIKADQEKNNTYTEESYKKLMAECEEGKNILDCLDKALADTTGSLDASECGDPDDKKDIIENVIKKLEPLSKDKPDDPNIAGVPDSSTPPSTGTWSTWQITILDRDYIIPIFPFIALIAVSVASVGLSIFLVRRHIKNKGIGDIKVTNLWSKDNYKLAYATGLAKKHADDPLTEVIDVSNIIKKYRIKFVLWHTIPALVILVAFLISTLATVSVAAHNDGVDIALTTADIGDTGITVVNIDKATSGDTVNFDILSIEMNTHIGSSYVGLFISGQTQQTDSKSTVLLNNLTIHTVETATSSSAVIRLSENNVPLPHTLTCPPLSYYSFTVGNINDSAENMVGANLINISDIDTGTYNIDLVFLIAAIQSNTFVNSGQALATLCSGLIIPD